VCISSCFQLSSNFIEIEKFETGGPCVADVCDDPLDCDPNDLFVTFEDLDLMPGASFCIPLTVRNFNSIATLQGGFSWDSSVLEFTGSQNYALPGMSNASVNGNNETGIGSFVWFDLSGATPQSLDDDATLFEACFDVIGGNGDKTLLKVGDSETAILQFADGDANVLPVCADGGCISVLSDEFTLVAENITVSDSVACVNILSSNFTEISGQQYAIKWDSTFMCLDSFINLNQSIFVLPSDFSLPNAGTLRYLWTGLGNSLPDNEILYTLCFTLKDPSCGEMTALSFVDDLVPIEIVGINSIVPFGISNGSVQYFSDGGSVSLADGSDAITVCVGDGTDDNIGFINTSVAFDPYQYIITDENNVIIEIMTESTFNFESSGVGVCRVWGVSFTGDLGLMVGQTLEDISMTDCFGLSDNFVEVTKVDSGASCSSVNEIIIDIIPNPAINDVKVRMTQMPDVNSSIVIVNELGQRFYQADIDYNNESQMDIDISGLPHGIYFLLFSSGDDMISKRFIVIE